jgi:hypothetical protein
VVSTTLPVALDREPSATLQITRFGAKKTAKRLRSVGFPAWTPVLTATITLTTSHRPISFHFSHFSLSFPFSRQNPAENVRGSLLAAHSRLRLVSPHALDGARFPEKTQLVPVSLRFATHFWVVDHHHRPCHRLLGFPTSGASSFTAASLRDSVQQERSALDRECLISRAPNHQIRSLDASSSRVFRKLEHTNAPPRASIVLRSPD